VLSDKDGLAGLKRKVRKFEMSNDSKKVESQKKEEPTGYEEEYITGNQSRQRLPIVGWKGKENECEGRLEEDI
jgi:hypothetical protein